MTLESQADEGKNTAEVTLRKIIRSDRSALSAMFHFYLLLRPSPIMPAL